MPAEQNSPGNRRRLPPLPALRAFEAAARRLSFRQAAEEIAVTPSAVSHQIKALEEFLGIALFTRNPDGLALTSAGATYLDELTPLLDALDASTRRVSRSGPAATINVLATPGFAARWLVPRLDSFAARDRISIAVSQGAPDTDFTRNNADVVIHWRTGPIAGADVLPMMTSGRFPVASREFIDRHGLKSPADLLGVTLLHDEVDDGWSEWFARAGVVAPQARRGPALAHCELTLGAAERHQGVALAYAAMARDALAGGQLVRLFDIETPATTIYSFAYPVGRRRCPDIAALRDWMFAEIETEGMLDERACRHAAE